MPQSFHTMKLIPCGYFARSIGNHTGMHTADLEQYEIVRDRETGEHYALCLFAC